MSSDFRISRGEQHLVKPEGKVTKAQDRVNEIRKYVARWAFLLEGAFGNDDSIRALRRDFGEISKAGMLVDITFDEATGTSGDYSTEDLNALDTVNDFVRLLRDRKINPYRDVR